MASTPQTTHQKTHIDPLLPESSMAAPRRRCVAQYQARQARQKGRDLKHLAFALLIIWPSWAGAAENFFHSGYDLMDRCDRTGPGESRADGSGKFAECLFYLSAIFDGDNVMGPYGKPKFCPSKRLSHEDLRQAFLRYAVSLKESGQFEVFFPVSAAVLGSLAFEEAWPCQ